MSMYDLSSSDRHRAESVRVLLVDDDANQLLICAELLGPTCRIETANSAKEAIEKLESQSFDVVLSDQCMPHMSGTQLLAEARRLQPGTRRVIMSAFADAAEILPAIDAGVVHRFVPKPIQPGRVLEEIELLPAPGDTVRCVLLDPNEAWAREIVEMLEREPALEVTCATALEGNAADLVLLVAPESVHAVADTIAEVRIQQRALMVALPPQAVRDSAGYLAAGADDILWLPLRADELYLRYLTWSAKRTTSQESARIRSEVAAHSAFPDIIGESKAMQRVFRQIYRVATSDASVLLTGETGTGKEIMARALHALSHRRNGPFLAVNLSALPETLVESELFGHEKGAFTGAGGGRVGRLEAVNGGTLLLDEVGDLSFYVQVKLLRVLEERRFERLGSTTPRKTDFRLVCATHRDLEALVANGSFREDLYYRINVVYIDLPPLRERVEDISLLAEHFLRRFSSKYGVEEVSMSEEALQALLRHDWPGNVRELQHLLERAVAMTSSGGRIDNEVLWIRKPRAFFRKEIEKYMADGRGLREILAHIEKTMLVETLERYGGNQAAAAKKLQIPRQTLQNRLKKYGL